MIDLAGYGLLMLFAGSGLLGVGVIIGLWIGIYLTEKVHKTEH